MINRLNCCGCGACSNICPKNAISMVENEQGFVIPVINTESCINCGMCERICPRLNVIECNVQEQKFYVAYHKNIDVRKTSSSGGIFTALSDYVLEHNGAVVGVEQNIDLTIEMKIAYTKEQRDLFKKSKYVQCRTNEIYKQVQQLLDKGILVLFTGVPCQVAALKLFLKKEYDNLICVDILCHGVVSESIFKEYIQHKEKKAGKKIVKFNFRDRHKELGWKKTVFSVEYADGAKEQLDSRFDYYWGLFYRNVAHRESCFSCKHRNIERTGDITLGDFWGVEKYFPDIDTFHGVSLLCVNNKKGKSIIEEISARIEKRECNLYEDLPLTMTGNDFPYKYRNNFFSLRRKWGFSMACFIHVFLFRVGMKLHVIKKNYR